MSGFYSMVTVQSILLIYLLVGVICNKTKIITKSSRQNFIDFLLQISLPCMVFESFNQTFTHEQLISGSIILAISFGISFFSTFAGRFLYRGYPKSQQSILKYGTAISNCAFAGLPLVAAIYGDIGVFYGSIFIIPNRIFMWTVGMSLFTQADRKTKLKKVLLNPGLIAVVLGLIRMLTAFPVPEVLNSAISSIGNCTPALSMICVGSIAADIPIKKILNKGAIHLSFVRLIGLPLILWGVLRMTPLDPIPTAVAVLLTAMPIGTTTALLADKYNADYEFAAKCLCTTTALSLITAPILALLL